MKIICIARNYADAAAEPGDTAAGGAGPVFFLKPDTALLRNNDPFYVPVAPPYFDEVGLGIDFTARDLQRSAMAEGLPWECCKAFDYSAALAPRFVPLAELGGDVQRLRFELAVDGEVRQCGDTAAMLFTVDRLIAHVSQYMTLRMGDLLFTGTPAGAGPVRPGENLTATLEGRTLLDFDIR